MHSPARQAHGARAPHNAVEQFLEQAVSTYTDAMLQFEASGAPRPPWRCGSRSPTRRPALEQNGKRNNSFGGRPEDNLENNDGTQKCHEQGASKRGLKRRRYDSLVCRCFRSSSAARLLPAQACVAVSQPEGIARPRRVCALAMHGCDLRQSVNECGFFATPAPCENEIDAGQGRRLWKWQRPRRARADVGLCHGSAITASGL